jgi:ribosomal protein S8
MLFKYPITQTADLFVYFCKKIQKTISYLFNIYFVKNIVINNLTSAQTNFYVTLLGFVETQPVLKPKSSLSNKKIEKIKSKSKKDIKKIKNTFKHIESQ